MVNRNPVKIIAVQGAGNRSKTGIPDIFPALFGKEEIIAAFGSFREPFADEIACHLDLGRIEESGGFDDLSH
jgi:hypothetical protein